MYETVSAARSGLARYIQFYNTRRPHSALDRRTPDAVYFKSLPLTPASLKRRIVHLTGRDSLFRLARPLLTLQLGSIAVLIQSQLLAPHSVGKEVESMLLQLDKSVEDYIAFAEERTRAFLASPPQDLFDLTKEIDVLIRDMCGRANVQRPFPLFLGLNAYYLFLASVRTAISGHVSGVFPLARAGLESACYAFLMNDDTALESIWTDRDKGDQQRAACRRAFTSAVKDAAQKLRSIDPNIGSYLQDLYDAAIAFGAHPNVMAVVPHIDVSEDEESKHWFVSFTCSYGEDSFEVKRAIVACVEYGLMIAYMIAHLADAASDSDDVSARFNRLHDRKNAAAAALSTE